MNIALFEDAGFVNLLPLVWLRACFELRCGRDLLVDKVRRHAGGRLARLMVRPRLSELVHDRTPLEPAVDGKNWCLLNARAMFVGDALLPRMGTAWVLNGSLVAVVLPPDEARTLDESLVRDEGRLEKWLGNFRIERPPAEVRLISYPWDLILANGPELMRQCRDGGVQAGRVYAGAHLLNSAAIHVGEGSVVKPGAVLDAEAGPIHVEGDVLIQPNAVLEGPCFVGERSIVRPGAVLRGGTTIGPVCKVGGEIESSVVQSHSNKQHDGFLGHSFVASWVNLGADTVTSDLKNTYGSIRVSINGVGVESGQHFLGAIVGDHTKTGIGTILPTGGVLGICANVFTHSGVPKFVPSFAWLTEQGLTRYRIEKALDIARTVMARRDVELTPGEEALLRACEQEAFEVEAAGWAGRV